MDSGGRADVNDKPRQWREGRGGMSSEKSMSWHDLSTEFERSDWLNEQGEKRHSNVPKSSQGYKEAIEG
jgi:hypothetical protein